MPLALWLVSNPRLNEEAVEQETVMAELSRAVAIAFLSFVLGISSLIPVVQRYTRFAISDAITFTPLSQYLPTASLY